MTKSEDVDPALAASLEAGLLELGTASAMRPPGVVPSHWHILSGHDRALLPLSPTEAELETAKIPEPPLLNPEGGPRYRFIELANWWITLCRLRFGDRCGKAWAFRSQLKIYRRQQYAILSRDKNFKLLGKAGLAMVSHDISPATWIDFTFNQWRDYVQQEKTAKPTKPAKKKKRRKPEPPSVSWVFDEDRIVKWRGWYRRTVPNGGLLLPGPTEIQLMRRYSAMEEQYRSIAPPERADRVGQVVATYFPDHSYPPMVDKARDENVAIQRVVDSMLQQRTWMWDSDSWRSDDGIKLLGMSSKI